MKKLSLILVLVLIFTFTFSLFSSATQLNEGGYIVLTENPDEKLTVAADTLSRYLKEITGKEFSVENDGTGVKFIIGYSDEAADNGYIIETGEKEVSITGNGTRGVIHGVYAFLEKYCECDWYTSTLYSIPKNVELIIPADEKTEYAPYFEYTDTDWVSPRDIEYSLANGLNGSPYRIIPENLGGNVTYISNFCHTLTTQFCASVTYFEEHPEYFALHLGRRTPDQLCLTNETVYEIVRDEVMALLSEKHNPNESLQIISLTQHDNQNMCQCSSCKAVDDENGSYSGTMISFVNRIAKDVKAAGYDNVAIDTFAYQYTRKAPTKVIPDDNVIVRLCTIECCFAHSLDDPECPENVDLMADLSAWSEICDRIYVWDYTTNYAQTLGIFPDFGVLQKNMQVFFENNVKGVYEEGNYYMASCDGEFGELRSYLLSKLMQNPYIDYDKYMNEFLEAYYGKGWQNIRDFLDLTIEKAVKNGKHLRIYSSMGETLGFNNDDIVKSDALWEAAKAEADNETHLLNIKRSEISWRYWKAYNTFGKEDTEKLVEDIKAFGNTMIHEGDTSGPDNLKFYYDKLKPIGDDVLFPLSIVLYAIAVALAVIIMIVALKNKPRKYGFIALTVLVGVFFEIFGWHRRAYIAWRDLSEYYLTLALIAILFLIGGALITKGIKKRILSAALCAVIWTIVYMTIMFISDRIGTSFAIASAYVFTGIEGITILSIILKNQLRK